MTDVRKMTVPALRAERGDLQRRIAGYQQTLDAVAEPTYLQGVITERDEARERLARLEAEIAYHDAWRWFRPSTWRRRATSRVF